MSLSKSSNSNKRRKQTANAVVSNFENVNEVTSPAVRNLLSQLAMAQGSVATTTSSDTSSQSVPSTSQSQSKTVRKNKKTVAAKNEKQQAQPSVTHAHPTRIKGSTVAARMSKKGPPPVQEFKPFGNSGRVRNNSNSTYREYRPMPSPMKPGPSGANAQRGPNIPEDILEELCFRFLLNIPEDEQRNEVRVCFQIELALWFFIDFYCKADSKTYREDCKDLGMREFTRQIFNKCDFLCASADNVDQVVDMWRHYKSNVPTYGAILLDSSLENVLLVQGYYSSKNSWGFPKGKVNESEHPRACAIREVKEEVGYDFGADRPKGNEPKIQKFINETMVRLYIVSDVPMDYKFEPMTRNEIRKIQWFNVFELPIDKNDQVARHTYQVSNNNFYTVIPFVQDLQNWINRERERRSRALHMNGPQGKVAKISSERQSAFTPVIPKTVNEKMTSAMTLLKQSSSGTNLSQRGEFSRCGNDAIFRPVATDGHTFLQMFSGGASASSSTQQSTSIAHPTPIKPKIDKPVYEAPHETQRSSKHNTKREKADKKSSVAALASSSSICASVSEIEIELQKLFGKENASNTQMLGEIERDTDTGSTLSVVMANELPMVAAIELKEMEGAAQQNLQVMEAHRQMLRTQQEQSTIQALEHLLGQYAQSGQPTINQYTAHELARRQRQQYANEMTSRAKEAAYAMQDRSRTIQTSGLGLVQLCEAWKNFTLDSTAILVGVPFK